MIDSVTVPVAHARVRAKGRHRRLGRRRIQTKQRIVETRVGGARVGRGGLARGTHDARGRGDVWFEACDAGRVAATQCARCLSARRKNKTHTCIFGIFSLGTKLLQILSTRIHCYWIRLDGAMCDVFPRLITKKPHLCDRAVPWARLCTPRMAGRSCASAHCWTRDT